MNKIIALSAATLAICLHATPGHAQATRTWVSGTGADVNPCSRTSPCATFAGALSKTAAGGEISVLDPGGFGAVTIAKAITLNGDGTLASVLAVGTNGITIAAGAADKVVLRNLSIQGAGTGLAGIRFNSGAQLTVDNVTIDGFTGNGIQTALSASADLVVLNTRITRVNNGISLSTSGPFLVAMIDNVTIANPTAAGVVQAGNGIGTTMTGSVIASSGSNAVSISTGNGFINVDNSSIVNNSTAFSALSSGSTIRISNNNIYGNVTGFTIGAGASILSSGNNRGGANGGGAPNGTIPPL